MSQRDQGIVQQPPALVFANPPRVGKYESRRGVRRLVDKKETIEATKQHDPRNKI